MQRSARKGALCACLLVLIACRIMGGDEAFILETTEDIEAIRFSSKAIERRCPNGVAISDLFVSREDCTRDCSWWALTRKTEFSKTERLLELPLMYGAEVPGSELRVAPRRLEFGTYSVGGTFACYNGEDLLSVIAFGRFYVSENGNVISNP